MGQDLSSKPVRKQLHVIMSINSDEYRDDGDTGNSDVYANKTPLSKPSKNVHVSERLYLRPVCFGTEHPKSIWLE